jgi:hypothetical protein
VRTRMYLHTKAPLEGSSGRERCPHDGHLLRADGRCWSCLRRPDEWQGVERLLANPNGRVEGQIEMELLV